MGDRRSPDALAAAQNWLRFTERNVGLVNAAGLPVAVVGSIRSWDDLLIHGYLPADPGQFAVERLSDAQYAALVQLAVNYFALGYEFYMPTALRPEDQDALRARFDRRP